MAAAATPERAVAWEKWREKARKATVEVALLKTHPQLEQPGAAIDVLETLEEAA